MSLFSVFDRWLPMWSLFIGAGFFLQLNLNGFDSSFTKTILGCVFVFLVGILLQRKTMHQEECKSEKFRSLNRLELAISNSVMLVLVICGISVVLWPFFTKTINYWANYALAYAIAQGIVIKWRV